MAAVAATYVTGRGGAVSVDTQVQPITDWDGENAVGTFDATNATTSGCAFPERTIETMTGSFTCVWKVTAGQPTMQVGNIYATVLTVQTGSTYSFNALIVSIGPKVDIKGGVTFSVKYASQGAITKPSA